MRALALALAVATLLASGCDNSDIKPNGKHHVLMFDSGFGALGEGLARDIILPREETQVRGCGKIDPICEAKLFRYDYDGTTLEADFNPGLRLVEAPLEDGGYRMRVGCDQAPEGGVGEVRVSIVASGGVRYADALDVACHRALASVAVSTAGLTVAGDYVGVPRQGCDYTFTGGDGTVLSRPGIPCFDHCIDAPRGGQLCVRSRPVIARKSG